MHRSGHDQQVLTTVSRGERVYFAAVGLLALWVGVWGFLIPGQVDKALPFLVPPLHARFLGAMYLSGLAVHGRRHPGPAPGPRPASSPR